MYVCVCVYIYIVADFIGGAESYNTFPEFVY